MTMTIRQRIEKLSSPIARQLLSDLADSLESAICINNENLPEIYRDNRTDCRSLEDINRIFKKRREDGLERHEHKIERNRRVELYSEQFDKNGTFEYEPWVVGAISAGRPNKLEF